MWHQIPNHDEEIFISYDHEVKAESYTDAHKACAMENAILLVLWKLPVLKFVTKYVFDYYKGWSEATGM